MFNGSCCLGLGGGCAPASGGEAYPGKGRLEVRDEPEKQSHVQGGCALRPRRECLFLASDLCGTTHLAHLLNTRVRFWSPSSKNLRVESGSHSLVLTILLNLHK